MFAADKDKIVEMEMETLLESVLPIFDIHTVLADLTFAECN